MGTAITTTIPRSTTTAITTTSAMCNTVMRSRHEDEWVFRWYGERNLNPKPTEWLHYLDAGMFLNPSYTSGDD